MPSTSKLIEVCPDIYVSPEELEVHEARMAAEQTAIDNEDTDSPSQAEEWRISQTRNDVQTNLKLKL